MDGTTVLGGDVDIPADIAATLIDATAYADDRIHEAYRWLRANNPLGIARPERHHPFWVVTRHADIQAISRQNELFHNGDRSTTLAAIAFEERARQITGRPNLVRSLVQMDAPDHPKYRALTQGWFMPANLVKFEPRIREIVDVDAQGRSSIDGIWAAGTIAGASVHTIITSGDGARVAVNLISGTKGERHVDHDAMPRPAEAAPAT